MIITPQHVHAKNWMVCPKCDGKPWTPREVRLGFFCGSCDNKGEVPRRRSPNVWAGYSTIYEREAGA